MSIKELVKKIIIKLIPVKKNRIVFTSFNGHYSDSPKYICEKMHELNESLELIWLVEEKFKDLLPKYVKSAKYGTREALYYYASAQIIVDNVYGEKETYLYDMAKREILKYKFYTFLNKKNKQRVYTTWHGIPIKKMGRDHVGLRKIYDFGCPNTTMILGSKYTLDIMKHLTFGKIKMQLINGSPRNDILYNKKLTFINEIKTKLGLPLDKKILLFAPTFRTESGSFEKNVKRSGIEQLNKMDFERLFNLLSNKFGGDWALVCRFHYHVEKLVDWETLKEKFGNRIINGNQNDDMAEYLLCTDVLVSDISSCIFDFAVTKKPIFCFFPDYQFYRDEERGLYIDTEDFPYKVAKEFDELAYDIESFNKDEYEMKLKKFINQYGSGDEKNSSLEIAKFILNDKR